MTAVETYKLEIVNYIKFASSVLNMEYKRRSLMFISLPCTINF